MYIHNVHNLQTHTHTLTTGMITTLLYLMWVLPEGPFQLLLRGTGGRHVDGEQELSEVNESVLVGVKGSEHMVAELLGVARGEEQLVHVNKLGRRQTAVWAVLLEPFVPLLYRVLVVACVALEEVEILLRQTLLALDTSHLNFLYVLNSLTN